MLVYPAFEYLLGEDLYALSREPMLWWEYPLMGEMLGDDFFTGLTFWRDACNTSNKNVRLKSYDNFKTLD